MDKHAPSLPISVVTEMTQLSPRQIRYYEQQGLITPARTTGRKRMFSYTQVEQLLQIKALMDKKMNIAGVKEVLHGTRNKENKEALSEEEFRQLLKLERTYPRRSGLSHLTQGELSRFFHKQ